ncbi:hypothetical protein GIB67_023749, partial [Kingdonia uniflora]
ALFLIFFPFSPSIISLTRPSTFSLVTLLSISILIAQSLQTYLQFVCCSAKSGQEIMGTPSDIFSNVEFYPLLVKKTPTEGCKVLVLVETNLLTNLFL